MRALALPELGFELDILSPEFSQSSQGARLPITLSLSKGLALPEMAMGVLSAQFQVRAKCILALF